MKSPIWIINNIVDTFILTIEEVSHRFLLIKFHHVDSHNFLDFDDFSQLCDFSVKSFLLKTSTSDKIFLFTGRPNDRKLHIK